MNQFRRAKQSSQQTERITDLKTAGVTAAPEKTVVSEQASVIHEKEETIQNDAAAVEAPDLDQTAYFLNTPEHQAENTSRSAIVSIDVPSVQPQKPVPQSITAQHSPAPVIQPQHQETDETLQTRMPKNSKKSAPNMFTQKSESKSIRKSLVLRPSSVRIAENYCAKNGGSFNELIQILLDNFIDEYGL